VTEPGPVHSRTGAGELALKIARRLLDPALVLATTPGDGSLGSGLAGTALLHARLSAVDPAFGAAAALHWAAAALLADHQPGGIYTGPGALATSLVIGVPYLPDPALYHDAVVRSSRWLSCRALAISGQHLDQVRAGDPAASWQTYDAITGLAGIGRVLLAAAAAGYHHAGPGLHAALTTLTTIITAYQGGRPGWWLPAAAHPDGVAVPASGAAATGTAHGIAGPLALLSAAQSAGWTVTGQEHAITAAARWLLHWREQSGSWPPCISGDELDQRQSGPARPGRRDAWCYGAAGIGRALAMAGTALGDPALAQAGQAAVAALARPPARAWDVTGRALCHGHAGILQSASRMGIGTVATRAADAILAESGRYRRIPLAHHGDHGGTDRAGRPGFLTGTAGIGLALADYAQLPAPQDVIAWDAILLLN
jgi:lantibiotic biosynthesis protein